MDQTRLSLNERTIQILALKCAEGMDNRAIARRLSLSPQTVRNIWTMILKGRGGVTTGKLCYDYCAEERDGVR
jgi:FixJ family two-component response regulator